MARANTALLKARTDAVRAESPSAGKAGCKSPRPTRILITSVIDPQFAAGCGELSMASRTVMGPLCSWSIRGP